MLALIVEDEAIAARTLRQLVIELAPDLVLEGRWPRSRPPPHRLASAPAPDLVFMDVQLADGLCFEIFDALPLAVPVIFTTAFDAFALKAFEVFGIDHLLKPIKPERLALALAKWRRLKGQRPGRGGAAGGPGAGLFPQRAAVPRPLPRAAGRAPAVHRRGRHRLLPQRNWW